MTARTILDFMNVDSLRRQGSSSWCGPCPRCGGDDRFVVLLDRSGRGVPGRCQCRECTPDEKWIDAIGYLIEYEGMTYPQAASAVGYENSGFSSSVRRTNQANQANQIGSVLVRSANTHNHANVDEPQIDRDRWQRVAGQFLEYCQQGLNVGDVPSGGIIKSLIVKRHISPATAIATGLGYYAGNKYVDAAEWGIPKELTSGSGKIRVPGPGIVITSRRSGKVVGVYVHFDTPEQYQNGSPCKGRMILGSAKDTPFIAGDEGKPCFIMESALDAGLVYQEGFGRVSAIGMNGGRKPVDDECMRFISKAPFLVFLGDKDANGAGASAMAYWRKIFSSARYYEQYAYKAKDIGEMHDKAFLDQSIPSASQFIKLVLQNIGS